MEGESLGTFMLTVGIVFVSTSTIALVLMKPARKFVIFLIGNPKAQKIALAVAIMLLIVELVLFRIF